MKQAVIGIIFDPSRQNVLILKRRDIPIWVFPGGGVDADELPEDAVIREIFEETGLKALIVKKIAEYTPINNLACLTHLYECKSVEGNLTTGSESCEIGYYPISHLPKDFFHIHDEWLNDALKNDPEVIRRPNTSITYWNLFLYFCKHPLRVIRTVLSRLGYPINKKE